MAPRQDAVFPVPQPARSPGNGSAWCQSAVGRSRLEASVVKDESKKKAQLIEELVEARRRISELESGASPSEPNEELRQAQEALETSEDRLRLALEATNDGLFDWNMKTGDAYYGPRYCTMLGYEPDELEATHETWVGLLHEDDRQRALDTVAEYGEGSSDSHEIEYRMRTKAGEWRWLLSRARVVERDEDGTPVRMVGTHVDITERKAVEGELRQSEARFRSLIEQTTDAVFCYEFDPPIRTGLPVDAQVGLMYDCTLVECNDRCARSYGANRARDVVGKKLTELFGTSPNSLDELFRAVVEGGYRVVDGEGTELLEDGSRRYFLNNGYGVVQDGRLLRMWGTFRDITERKQAEHLLRAQQELGMELAAARGIKEMLRLFVETAIEISGMDCAGVYLVDPVSNDLDLAYHKGLPEGFVESASHYDAQSASGRLILSGKPVHARHDVIGLPMDKERRSEGLKAIAIIPILHEDKVIACLTVCSHTLDDVSDFASTALETIAAQIGSAITRARVEEALHQSRANLQTLFDSLEDFLFVLDMEGRILRVNPIVLTRLGYSEEEMLGESVLMMHAPDCRDEAAEIVAALIAGEADSCAVPMTTKDGELIPVETVVVRGRWNDQEALFGICRDITERRQAEEERERLLAQIQEQARRVRQIVDTVPEGVVLLDPNGQIMLANPMGEDNLRVLAGVEIGDELVHVGDRTLGDVLEPPPHGLWHEATIDDRSFQVAARPLELEAATGGWVLVIRDVTRERQIEKHLQQQERLAAVGRLAAGVAHDFNNIMSTVVLYSQMTAQEEETSERVRGRMQTINEQAEHATQLIQQILDFSRRTVLERHRIDLGSFLEQQIGLLKRTLPENIEIELARGTGEYVVDADSTRIQQVIMNLALNARDAMPEGGALRIGLDNLRFRREKAAPLPEMEPGKWVVLSVADTGTGIAPDLLPHIFEPFFTTKAPLGSGLGLSQVHGIVAQHDGHISVDSRPGEGATFTIYFPAADGKAEEPTPA
ncbi:MAG: PAS domain S-box protein, partial [Anaerolineales bacterium]